LTRPKARLAQMPLLSLVPPLQMLLQMLHVLRTPAALRLVHGMRPSLILMGMRQGQR